MPQHYQAGGNKIGRPIAFTDSVSVLAVASSATLMYMLGNKFQIQYTVMLRFLTVLIKGTRVSSAQSLLTFGSNISTSVGALLLNKKTHVQPTDHRL